MALAVPPWLLLVLSRTVLVNICVTYHSYRTILSREKPENPKNVNEITQDMEGGQATACCDMFGQVAPAADSI